MTEMLGYTLDEFLGRELRDFMDEVAWEQAKRNLARRRQGIRERHDFCLKHKDGRDVYVTMSTAPILDGDGVYQGALALVTDVTEAQRLGRKLQHTQKLESLGVLAGGIAHDFNNILAGILGNIGLAQHETRADSRASFFLDEAENAARRAADLTRQMLAYSGRASFVTEPVDLNQCVLEVKSLLATVVSKNASLRVELSSKPPWALGDATQLRQVIMNLVLNAGEALAGLPGVVLVRTSLVRAGPEDLRNSYLADDLAPGNYACIEVSDSGSGMDQETLSRFFDPFFTTKASGHGLGLAAVLGILRAHRAGIFIDSELKRGTSIKVMLPETPPRVAASHAGGSQRSMRPRAGRVLVADDEAAVRDVTCRALSRMGFECLPCENGEQALNLLAAADVPVDLVVLDMTMPHVGGQEVLQEMRRLGQRTPVMLMSGYVSDETSQAMSQLGPTVFIEKPFGPRELSERVRRLLPEQDDESS